MNFEWGHNEQLQGKVFKALFNSSATKLRVFLSSDLNFLVLHAEYTIIRLDLKLADSLANLFSFAVFAENPI